MLRIFLTFAFWLVIVGCVVIKPETVLSELVDEGFVEVDRTAVIEMSAIVGVLNRSPNLYGTKGVTEKWFVKGRERVLVLVFDERSYASQRCGYSKTILKRDSSEWVIESEVFRPCESRV